MSPFNPTHVSQFERRQVPLTAGFVAVVDASDYDRVASFKWFALRLPSGLVYGARTIGSRPGKRRSLLMHRFILGCDGEQTKVDHRDGDGLNNTRDNLRRATGLQNNRNRGPQANNTCGFKGVRPTRNGRFGAVIKTSQRQMHLGHFQTAEEAARAYDAAAREHFGTFAWLNFPHQNEARA